MAKNSFWADLFSGAKEAGLVPEASVEPPTAPISAPAPQSAAPLPLASDARDQELAQLRAELAQARAEQIQKDARAFVASNSARIYPAEAAALGALYVRAAEIDYAHPRNDGQPSCTALLDAAVSARPAHHMASDLLPAGGKASVLTNNTGGDQDMLDQAEASAKAYAARANGRRN